MKRYLLRFIFVTPIFCVNIFRRFLTTAHKQSSGAESHVNEPGIGFRLVGVENLPYPGGSFRILCYHVEETTTTGARELVTKTEVVNKACETANLVRISA